MPMRGILLIKNHQDKDKIIKQLKYLIDEMSWQFEKEGFIIEFLNDYSGIIKKENIFKIKD